LSPGNTSNPATLLCCGLPGAARRGVAAAAAACCGNDGSSKRNGSTMSRGSSSRQRPITRSAMYGSGGSGGRGGSRGSRRAGAAAGRFGDGSCCVTTGCPCCTSPANGGDASAAAEGGGLGAPGPLVVAMYRELLEDASFRNPLAWRNAAGVPAGALWLPAAPRRQRSRRRTHGSSSRRKSGSTSSGSAKSGRRSGTGSSGGGGSGSSGSSSGTESSETDDGAGGGLGAGALAGTDDVVQPDELDGILVPGAYPSPTVNTGDGAAGARGGDSLWDDAQLQALVTHFWVGGRPVAALGNGPLLLTRARDHTGASLLRGATGTAVAAHTEFTRALLDGLSSWQWGALAALVTGRARSTAAQVCSVMQVPSVQFRHGPSPYSVGALLAGVATSTFPLLRAPSPWAGQAVVQGAGGGAPLPEAVVAEDGAYLSAEGAGDAFQLARRFTAKLEEVQRMF
jgi:putative intracellular protease/amidase